MCVSVRVRVAARTVATAFISSRLDYCNALLCGLPNTLLCKLQSVQNATARLITGTRRCDHITPVLRELHWLPIRERVKLPNSPVAVRAVTCLPGRWLSPRLGQHPWRPRLSGGCSGCTEQSVTRNSGLLLTFDIPEGDQVSPFSSVSCLHGGCLLESSWSSPLHAATSTADFCHYLHHSVCLPTMDGYNRRVDLRILSLLFRIFDHVR